MLQFGWNTASVFVTCLVQRNDIVGKHVLSSPLSTTNGCPSLPLFDHPCNPLPSSSCHYPSPA